MAKFVGSVGIGKSVETSPGVWVVKHTECTCAGEILKNSKRTQQTSELNDNVVLSNDISIIADPFVLENFGDIRYVKILGVNWKVTSIELNYPRITMTTGGVYNGETT